MMGDISSNFSRSEHACDCANQGKKREDGYCGGAFDVVDVELNRCMEEIRNRVCRVVGVAVYVVITGGYRCKKHKADIGGAERSYHIMAKANDFKVFMVNGRIPVSSSTVYEAVDSLYPDKYGLKQYSNRVHFDVRPTKWRSPL